MSTRVHTILTLLLSLTLATAPLYGLAGGTSCTQSPDANQASAAAPAVGDGHDDRLSSAGDPVGADSSICQCEAPCDQTCSACLSCAVGLTTGIPFLSVADSFSLGFTTKSIHISDLPDEVRPPRTISL